MGPVLRQDSELLMPRTLPPLNPPPASQTDQEKYLHARSRTVPTPRPTSTADDDDDSEYLEDWIACPWKQPRVSQASLLGVTGISQLIL